MFACSSSAHFPLHRELAAIHAMPLFFLVFSMNRTLHQTQYLPLNNDTYQYFSMCSAENYRLKKTQTLLNSKHSHVITKNSLKWLNYEVKLILYDTNTLRQP